MTLLYAATFPTSLGRLTAAEQKQVNAERQLQYVAATKARDRRWLSGVEPGSEFLGDLG